MIPSKPSNTKAPPTIAHHKHQPTYEFVSQSKRNYYSPKFGLIVWLSYWKDHKIGEQLLKGTESMIVLMFNSISAYYDFMIHTSFGSTIQSHFYFLLIVHVKKSSTGAILPSKVFTAKQLPKSWICRSHTCSLPWHCTPMSKKAQVRENDFFINHHQAFSLAPHIRGPPALWAF